MQNDLQFINCAPDTLIIFHLSPAAMTTRCESSAVAAIARRQTDERTEENVEDQRINFMKMITCEMGLNTRALYA